MATLLCDHHLGFMPEFSDLTVIGKWTGNVDDPVGMKITVDVRCPSTSVSRRLLILGCI